MDENLRKIFAENLRRLMHLEQKTQADLSRYMKISSATASDWYNGYKLPRTDKLQSIANWLGVELSTLISEHSPEKSPDYFLDPDARDAAAFLHENPDYKVLMDSVKNVKPEDISFIKEMIDRANK